MSDGAYFWLGFWVGAVSGAIVIVIVVEFAHWLYYRSRRYRNK